MVRVNRLSVLHVALALFALALTARAAKVQLLDGKIWGRAAEKQHLAQTSLDAPRGEIRDAAGVPLVRSQERVRIAIAPPEVRDMRELTRALSRLGVGRSVIRRVSDRKHKWVELSETFQPSDVVVLARMPGVHARSVSERLYVASDGVRRIVGRTGSGGVAVDGLELALDSLLRGVRGRTAAFRGANGERYESPDLLTEPPRAGSTVTLTIHLALQDICDRALAEAAAHLGAEGGDIVVLDPRDGEVRCLASRRAGSRVGAATAVTEPFEPGSTLKPLYAGALVERGLARVDEMIETFDGRYTVAGRTINDVHKAERLSLADVIRFSSNVGIARFSERLTDREQYELLRDYGFGTPTGMTYPSEAAGTLREVRKWTAQSHASLAIGYEISVTPLQLAVAYGAIANGGRLMQPAIVKSVQDADGRTIYTHSPRVVRQVLTPETCATLRRILQSVVDSGTATDAELATFNLAGKSGTARRTSGGRYGQGMYTSTFIGIFPGDDPQYVVLVKIDNPAKTYYGGKAAAPVARNVIEAAIASRSVNLDGRTLAAQKIRSAPRFDPAPVPLEQVVDAGAVVEDSAPRGPALPPVSLVDTMPEPPLRGPIRFDLGRPLRDVPRTDSLVSVPPVAGLPLRVAVRELHRAGLKVVLAGSGDGATQPAAGAQVRSGTVVRLWRP
ncbi:MAG: Peptidoglycan D,D-transpeptidase FtsI [Gemmatimonadaceae bacterium]|nr:Peptidoglycan D,D-transpeptidase FtsI [Gemmatimonadaceae bacterium]